MKEQLNYNPTPTKCQEFASLIEADEGYRVFNTYTPYISTMGKFYSKQRSFLSITSASMWAGGGRLTFNNALYTTTPLIVTIQDYSLQDKELLDNFFSWIVDNQFMPYFYYKSLRTYYFVYKLSYPLPLHVVKRRKRKGRYTFMMMDTEGVEVVNQLIQKVEEGFNDYRVSALPFVILPVPDEIFFGGFIIDKEV